jgi:hypothetical protein
MKRRYGLAGLALVLTSGVAVAENPVQPLSIVDPEHYQAIQQRFALATQLCRAGNQYICEKVLFSDLSVAPGRDEWSEIAAEFSQACQLGDQKACQDYQTHRDYTFKVLAMLQSSTPQPDAGQGTTPRPPTPQQGMAPPSTPQPGLQGRIGPPTADTPPSQPRSTLEDGPQVADFPPIDWGMLPRFIQVITIKRSPHYEKHWSMGNWTQIEDCDCLNILFEQRSQLPPNWSFDAKGYNADGVGVVHGTFVDDIKFRWTKPGQRNYIDLYLPPDLTKFQLKIIKMERHVLGE